MDINVVHGYSYLVETLLRTTYNTLGVNLTGTLQICDGFARSKAKARAAREKNYTRSSQTGESVFMDMAVPFLESLIWNRYWTGGSRRITPLFLEFLQKYQVTTAEKDGRVFLEDHFTWDAS